MFAFILWRYFPLLLSLYFFLLGPGCDCVWLAIVICLGCVLAIRGTSNKEGYWLEYWTNKSMESLFLRIVIVGIPTLLKPVFTR